jgi:hypothetical protein
LAQILGIQDRISRVHSDGFLDVKQLFRTQGSDLRTQAGLIHRTDLITQDAGGSAVHLNERLGGIKRIDIAGDGLYDDRVPYRLRESFEMTTAGRIFLISVPRS